MAGRFDQYRFNAKRKRNEHTSLPTAPRVKATSEHDIEKTTMKIVGRQDIHTSEQKKISDCFSSKWQERWHAICSDCFEHAQVCTHYREHRLRVLLVGHNPSDHAWQSGYSYSNPTNRMWKLLTGTLSTQSWNGLLPSTAKISEQNIMPDVLGIGFTSIGLEPGNNAAKYGKATMEAWRDDFYLRLRRHAAQVCIVDHDNNAMDIAINHGGDDKRRLTKRCQLPHAPMLIAFAGKRQFSWLFSPPLSKVASYGRQNKFPPGWPEELCADSELWVLPSSSGRAAMTTIQRMLPYQQLAERVRQLP